MFALNSRRLRRRLSAPSSASARRRARERRKAELTRAEGERLARERRERQYREKIEQQKQSQAELASYEPWGRAGGGAPNAQGVRYSDLRAGGIYPEDELKGVSQYESCHRCISPRRRRRTPLRLHEDPQLCYADCLRQTVDNDIRYRQTPDQQKSYRDILDNMVDTRKKAIKNEIKKDLECERKMQTMEGPWGKPGPGGTVWRNPRDIGLNFSKSMGWTDNEIFNKMKGEHKRYKRSSLTLPKVKKDDDTAVNKTVKPSSVEKLPDIKAKPNSDEENNERPTRECNEQTKEANGSNSKTKKNKKKETFVKRLSNGERLTRMVPYAEDNLEDKDLVGDNKLTPEATILRLTGGIELVPLFARRRRVGARTLPSSDVTRPPDQDCQWRELTNVDYLRDLKNQIRIKCDEKEEKRRDSAENCLRHHATWASLWGRPGHGAPQQRGRYARNNLARLLYVAPLAPAPPAQ